MIFRWGTCLAIIALYFAAVTGCAKRKLYGSQFQSGYLDCPTNNLGQFRLQLAVAEEDPSQLVLTMQVLEFPQPGILVHAALANANNNPPYRDIFVARKLVRGEVINLGSLTRDDVKYYPSLVLAPYDGNPDPNSFLSSSASKGVVCDIPNKDSETQYPL